MSSPNHPLHPGRNEASLLFGRDREQTLLRDTLRATLAGHGSLVLIGGEAGIGKTSLAEAIGRDAATEEAIVLVGRCYDLTETPPYGPWRELLDGVPLPDGSPAPPIVFESNRAMEGITSQQALYAEARMFLTALAARHPVIVLLDDLHWSDIASLDLLRFLVRDVHAHALLLVVVYRDDEIPRQHPLSNLLPALVRESRTVRLTLRPLDVSAAWSLVEHRYRLPEADRSRLVAYLQQHAEGNPLFLTEILRTLEEEEVLQEFDGSWRLGDLLRMRVPSLVRQVIEGRLARLGQKSEALLQVAAVIGQEVRLDIWRTVSDASDEQLSVAIEQAVEAHILLEAPDRAAMRFTHALIREALYEAIGLMRRIMWHHRIAKALLAFPKPDPDSVAYHLQQAQDPLAAEWLVRAGDRARRAYAWETARERYESALALLTDGPGTTERGWILYRLANVFLSSDPQRALTILDDVRLYAEASNDRALLAQTAFFWGSFTCQNGDYPSGLREMRAGFATLESLSEHERARRQEFLKASSVEFDPVGESGLVMWLAATGHYVEVLAIGERTDTFEPANANRDSAGALMAYGYLGLALTYASTGQPDRARWAYSEARARYQARDNRIGLYMALTHEMVNLALPYEADRLDRRRRLTAALEDAWSRATTGNIDQSARQGLLPLLALEGDWEDARRLALAGLARGMGGASRAFPTRALIGIACAQGDSELAWQLVHNDLPDGPASNPGGTIYTTSLVLLRAAAELLIDAGDIVAATAWLRTHDRWLSWAGARLGRAESHLVWARYHRASGDVARAFSHAEQALECATHPRQPLALLAAHRFLGELDTASGRYTTARTHLDASLAIADACAAPYERAITLLALAELQTTSGDLPAARTLADEVRTICTPLGARPALARADALAATPSATRDGYPDRLTPREVEVLRLIAAGQSNQAIASRLSISVRTVNRHITNLYTKIGAHGKADATAYAFRHHLI